MEQNVKKRSLGLKITCIVLAVLVGIFAVLGITFACVWNNEIATVGSFKKLRDRNDGNKEGAVYRMDVKGGFYFDEFLEQGGAKNDTELINFITNNITKGLIDMTIKETDIGCSSFTATTESGDKLFARNYDFDKTNICITLCDPGKGRHKSFSSVDLNYVGMDVDKDVTGLMNKVTCLAAPFAPLDGINDVGVSCGIYMSYQGPGENVAIATDQNDETKKNITSTTMLRMVLDYADDVDEAVELVSSYNLHDSAHTSFHYMIADATGKSAILEWVPADNAKDLTDTDGANRVLKVTYNTDERYGKTVSVDGRYTEYRNPDGVPFQWITNFLIEENYYEGTETEQMYGLDRYNHIYSRLKATDGVVKDDWAAMEILKEVGRRKWNGGGGCTVHSAVYNLTKKTATWVANENYSDQTAVYEYSLETGKLTRLA